MTTIDEPPVQPVDFASEHSVALPVEVLDYTELVERMGSDYFAHAQRPSFELMIFVRAGTGTHTIDFQRHALHPGRALFIRPGQVQQWHIENTVDAVVVVASPAASSAVSWLPGDAPSADLGKDSQTTAHALVAALEREQQRFTADEHTIKLITALFASLVALFHQASTGPGRGALPPAYVAFRGAIESDLTRSRNVRDFAAGLGYSERTISRACQSVTGLTAKAVLDERLMLEAKRLLAHSDHTLANISTMVGFSEPTNFSKFFERVTGQTPTNFRQSLRDNLYRGEH
ncbi:helix-turn-helix domain-containing protein [Salinibacterium sp. PAMC 21357]|uniref:helix-turn-helix domain-containing protein n=1 Tax=Salinibacterium sp. PAMC 21357 TaxID=1112215 RepID=UPI0002894D86|nr:AraC family transcriptional regulator [Salinibacterium sp. PAMC 21357]